MPMLLVAGLLLIGGAWLGWKHFGPAPPYVRINPVGDPRSVLQRLGDSSQYADARFFSLDLDGDGRNETIAVIPTTNFATPDAGFHGVELLSEKDAALVSRARYAHGFPYPPDHVEAWKPDGVHTMAVVGLSGGGSGGFGLSLFLYWLDGRFRTFSTESVSEYPISLVSDPRGGTAIRALAEVISGSCNAYRLSVPRYYRWKWALEKVEDVSPEFRSCYERDIANYIREAHDGSVAISRNRTNVEARITAINRSRSICGMPSLTATEEEGMLKEVRKAEASP